MVKNEAGGCKGKKVARKHSTKGKNELRLSASLNEKYAIVKRLLGNTCDVICDDGKERRCFIRGKFTGRNKRDNMIDSGKYILVGLREWVAEDMKSDTHGGGDKNIKFCDLLEVYSSVERDLLRRTHGIFSSLKDESDDSSVRFVDDNTLKYQKMIKKMDETGKTSENDEDDCGVQGTVITTKTKHVGKGVIVQSFDISDDDSDDGDDGDDSDDVVDNSNDLKKVVDKNKNNKNNIIDENIVVFVNKTVNVKVKVSSKEQEISVDDI